MTPEEVEKKCQALRDLGILHNLGKVKYSQEEVEQARERLKNYLYEEKIKKLQKMVEEGFEPDRDAINEERKLLSLNNY